MDLNEQAEQAVARILLDGGFHLDSYELGVARLAWLEGYEAGMKATQAKASEAFGEWAATQIGPQS